MKEDFKNVLQASIQKQWDQVRHAMSAFTYFEALDEVWIYTPIIFLIADHVIVTVVIIFSYIWSNLLEAYTPFSYFFVTYIKWSSGCFGVSSLVRIHNVSISILILCHKLMS